MSKLTAAAIADTMERGAAAYTPCKTDAPSTVVHDVVLAMLDALAAAHPNEFRQPTDRDLPALFHALDAMHIGDDD